MAFWWCPFPLLTCVLEQLRQEGLRRWTQTPEHCPSDGILVVPLPEDVLLACTTRTKTVQLNQDDLRAGYEELKHWHQKRRLSLRCDLKNTESTHPHIKGLIQALNRSHPDILETAYRLRGEPAPISDPNLDPIAAWCDFEQARRQTIALQHQLLEQYQQHQRSSRTLISHLISRIEATQAMQPAPLEQPDDPEWTNQ